MASKYQTEIIKEYKSKGYIVWNVIKLSDSGYPDLAMFKDGKTIFIEVKEPGDTLKELQKFRIDELIKQGFTAFCIQKNKGIIYGTNSNQNPNPITR